MRGAVYDTTGRIRRTFNVPERDLDKQAKDGELLFESEADQRLHYIVDGEPPTRMDKTVFAPDFDKLSILADAIEVATLAGVPDGSIIIVDGEPTEVADGTFELLFSSVGEYVVRFHHPHFLPKEWLINGN